MVALVAGCPTAARAQASIQTVRTNGPLANRFNIVFLSEGYTAADVPQYSVDATNALMALLSHQPYQEYSNYFNAFAIRTNSVQSGSDHPVDNIYVNTYFNSTYDPVSDYYITIPTNSTGQGRVDALLQSLMPRCNLPVFAGERPHPCRRLGWIWLDRHHLNGLRHARNPYPRDRPRGRQPGR